MTTFVVLYRWRIAPDRETQFVQAWARMTALLKTRGSLGARLHRGSDGTWYSYAQWPSAEHRERAFAETTDAEAAALMREAIVEPFPEVVLDVRADALEPL